MARGLKWILCLTSGALLGFSFPPFETGMLAAVAFVPFLFALSMVENYTDLLRVSYLTFFTLGLIALYWPGGFVHGRDGYLMISGGLLLVVHPLFMSIPVFAWYAVRRAFGMKIGLLCFPVLWIAFEYLHSATQFAFPWLTLGNTQTYDLPAIQFASLTGVYGVSFWLVLLNIAVFYLGVKLLLGEWRPASRNTALMTLCIVLLYAAPHAWGVFFRPDVGTRTPGELSVGVVQPDIDPFLKWEGEEGGQARVLWDLTRDAAASRPGLVMWPETSVPYYILSPSREPEYLGLKSFIDSLGIPLLAGIPDIIYYDTTGNVPAGVKISWDGRPYENFNSSMLLIPGSAVIQKCAKSLLVPFAEHVPYSDVLGFLNAAQWNFGLGGWSIGRDSTVFALPVARGGGPGDGMTDTVRFSNLICYESIFPGYVASLVRKGAEFVTIVTNDSWWGNTAGPYQHRQFTVLRAVENRRWFVQCANGGISFFVDPSGRIHEQLPLFTAGVLAGTITPESDLTFYSRHGDWFAEMFLVLAFLITGASVIHTLTRKSMEGKG